MSTVLYWQMEEPDDNAKTCFLGYDRCWCESCCRVTVGMKLDRITDNGAVNFYSRVTYEPWDRAGTQLPATASQHSANVRAKFGEQSLTQFYAVWQLL